MYLQCAAYAVIAFILTFGVTSVHGVTWKTFLGSLGGSGRQVVGMALAFG